MRLLTDGTGVLAGIRVVELGGIGPASLCAALLSDHGADIVRIERPAGGETEILKDRRFDLTLRGRRLVHADLRDPEARRSVLELVSKAHMFVDPFRPGKTENLGIGPEDCLRVNPSLIYGRLTGWGQRGPLAQSAGHDINYLAITGILNAIGASDHPVPPLNLVADMGGGSLFLAFGLLAAHLNAIKTGRGQVVDVAITDAALYLALGLFGFRANQWMNEKRQANLVDGGAPFYRCYRTADDRFVAVGAVERRFLDALLSQLGLERLSAADPFDRSAWPPLAEALERVFLTRTRDDWTREFEGKDVCVTPVLAWSEVEHHPQNLARGNMTVLDGIVQPGPTPRFSHSGAEIQSAPLQMTVNIETVITEWQ